MIEMEPIRLGTRASLLARQQTKEASNALNTYNVDTIEIPISTEGDRDQTTSLLTLGGQGIFVRQIELALIEKKIDVAVHSAKDVPSTIAEGTTLAAILTRADVRDALVSCNNITLDDLPRGSRIGSSSKRRHAQLLLHRPDLIPVTIRGNVDTRLRKLKESGSSQGKYDAVVLAVAGLSRLQRLNEATEVLPIDIMLPSPGQGAIVLQTRTDDTSTLTAMQTVNHQDTAIAVSAERAVLACLGAGCTTPIAALAHVRLSEISCLARMFDPTGKKSITVQRQGPSNDPEALGYAVGDALLAKGASKLLQDSEQ